MSFKTTEEVKEEEEEVTASLAALKEISADAAGVAVLSKLDGIVTLKEERKTALKAFLCKKNHDFGNS